jgi:uncharacterized membrane protein YgcG
MKKYKIAILIFVGLAILCGVFYAIRQKTGLSHGARTNTQCTTDERVFDYDNVLSDSEEDELRAIISEYEDKLGIDIAVVTLNYQTDFSYMGVTSNYDLQYLTECFVDYYRFGWENWTDVSNKYYRYECGASMVIAANWDAGELWICTSGKVMEKIDDYTASEIAEDGANYLRKNPVKGYKTMFKDAKRYMVGNGSVEFRENCEIMTSWGSILVALIATAIFFGMNYSKKAAKKTTNASTYVEGGAADILERQDVLFDRRVTSVRINTGGGGPGGGGGSGGGGGTHF